MDVWHVQVLETSGEGGRRVVITVSARAALPSSIPSTSMPAVELSLLTPGELVLAELDVLGFESPPRIEHVWDFIGRTELERTPQKGQFLGYVCEFGLSSELETSDPADLDSFLHLLIFHAGRGGRSRGTQCQDICLTCSREFYDNASSGNYRFGDMKLAYDW